MTNTFNDTSVADYKSNKVKIPTNVHIGTEQ